MDRLRILEVTPVFPPARSGGAAPRVVYELSKRLVQRGHEVSVYATDFSDGRQRLDAGAREVEGVRVSYFRNLFNSLESRQKFFLAPSMAAAAGMNISQFDIVHCHGFRVFTDLVVHRYAMRRDIPYVLHTHGSTYPLQRRGLKRAYDILRGYRILADAGRIIANSATDARFIMLMGVQDFKMEVIPNGFDMGEFSALPDRGAFRAKHGFAPSDRVVLHVGRVHLSRGLDLLLKAAAAAAADVPDLRLAIVGQDDGFTGGAKRLARQLGLGGRVVFTGFVSEEEKLSAYVDSDVFFSHTSHGTPLLAFVEALACGLPVVTTDNMDTVVRRQEIDGVAGLVASCEANDIAAALRRLLRDDGWRRSLGANGRRLAGDWQSWDTFTDRVEQVYAGVLERERRVASVARPSTRRVSIAVVSTVWNEGRNISRLLDSLLAQSRKPDQIVIVDGGSTDGTVKVLESYAARSDNIKVLVRPKTNISAGRNIAISAAASEVIANINGDCRADPEWVANLLRPFEDDANVDVVSGSCEIEAHNELQVILNEVARLKYRNEARATYLPVGNSVAFKKEAWAKVGGYPEWLDRGEDSLFHTHLRRAGCKFALAREARVHWETRTDLRQLYHQYRAYSRGDAMAGTVSYIGNTRYLVDYFGFMLRAIFSGVRRGKLSSLYLGPLVAATQFSALLAGRVSGFRKLLKRKDV